MAEHQHANLLKLCWDEAWEAVCNSAWHKKPGNCWMLISDDMNDTYDNASAYYPSRCTATCNSYGIPVTGCDEVFAKHGCPGAATQSSNSGHHGGPHKKGWH